MFYNITNEDDRVWFQEALQRLTKIFGRTYTADMLISLARNMGFLENKSFIDAFNLNVSSKQEESLLWRLHTLAFAVESCKVLEGDFVECGVFQGFSTKVLADYLKFNEIDKKWYLFDTFQGIPLEDDTLNMNQTGYKQEGLYESVLNKFEQYKNIEIVKGKVPESLDNVEFNKIAFIHIDMNNAKAEVGALNKLFDKVVSGGIIIFDDYGWYAYRDQKLAIDDFLTKKGHNVLELPTGQGMVIKR